MARIAQIDWPESRERDAVSPIAGRHHAIEHVDAARDRLQNISACRAPCSNAAGRRGEPKRLLGRGQHLRLRLAHLRVHRSRSRRNPISTRPRALVSRRPATSPPARCRTAWCPVEHSSRGRWSAPPNAATIHGTLDRRRARPATAHTRRAHGDVRPSRRCTSIDRSGDSSTLAPSICERNVTAFLADFHGSARHHLEAAESVSIGPRQPVKRATRREPRCAPRPGRRIRW